MHHLSQGDFLPLRDFAQKVAFTRHGVHYSEEHPTENVGVKAGHSATMLLGFEPLGGWWKQDGAKVCSVFTYHGDFSTGASSGLCMAPESYSVRSWDIDLRTPMCVKTPSHASVDTTLKLETESTQLGIYGLMHQNSVMKLPDMGIGKAVGFREEFSGKACSGWTPHSQEAGSQLRLAAGVRIRWWTKEMTEIMDWACSLDGYGSSSEQWTVFVCGRRLRMGEREAISIYHRSYEASMTSPDSPTPHLLKDSKALVLSCSVGTLMRRSMGDTGRWIDSSCEAYESGYLQGMRYLNATFFTVPFLCQNTPSRTLLGCNHANQALTLPESATSGGGTAKPLQAFSPIVSTPFGRELERRGHLLPGCSIIVAYANLADTFEDSVVMSRRLRDLGCFSRMVEYPIPISQEARVEEGDKIHRSTHLWWKCESGGVVSRVRQSADASHLVVTVRYMESLSTGDKVSTLHGQKAVCVLWPPEDMPWVEDSRGEVVQIDMVVSTTSLTKRGTVGQASESSYAVEAMRTGRTSVEPTNSWMLDNIGTLYDGRTGMSPSGPDGGNTRCSWGICTVLPSMHTADDKQHFTHTVSPVVASKAGGGGVSLGEMEQSMLLGQGMPRTVEELRSRQANVDAKVCTRCNRLCITCTCEGEATHVQVRVPKGIMRLESTLVCGMSKSLEMKV